jgi:hypothetical protein
MEKGGDAIRAINFEVDCTADKIPSEKKTVKNIIKPAGVQNLYLQRKYVMYIWTNKQLDSSRILLETPKYCWEKIYNKV